MQLTDEDRQDARRVLEVYIRECTREIALGNQRLATWWAERAFSHRDGMAKLEREDA